MSSVKKPRPLWRNVLIWVGIAYLVLNAFGIVLFAMHRLATYGDVGGIVVIAGLAVFWWLGGFNVIRTWANKSTADFARREDPATGGYTYDVRPARASWLPVLVIVPLGIFLAVLWSGVVAFLLCLFVASTILLPGARQRKRARISVSPHALVGNGVSLPIERIAEISVGNNGVRVSREPLVVGPGGVPTSTLVGRGLGRRQAARSFTLMVRGDGESHASVIAGGLTAECAENLARDIYKLVEVFRYARPA